MGNLTLCPDSALPIMKRRWWERGRRKTMNRNRSAAYSSSVAGGDEAYMALLLSLPFLPYYVPLPLHQCLSWMMRFSDV